MVDAITQQQIKGEYDCVVIGAGNGGLDAAARLAAAGVRVLILEQHNLPGGFATSFTRGRFWRGEGSGCPSSSSTAIHFCPNESSYSPISNFRNLLNLSAYF